MVTDQILIIDNEIRTISLVRQILTDAGFEVLVANKGERALQMAALEHLLLIILDINLAGEIDGFEVLRRLREFSDTPIIILSSRSDPKDILQGYDLGIDDYVTKPFNAKIFLARIRAILKRDKSIFSDQMPNEMVVFDLVINFPRRRVTREGVEIHLTPTEYNLFVELVTHSNQVLVHEHLLTAVWGDKFQNEVDYLRSYIHLLRRKLECDPTQPKIIISKPGIGYMLVSDNY